MPLRKGKPARNYSSWDKGFYASFGVFCSVVFLLVCAKVFPSPSEVINSPFTGFEQWVKFLDALDRVQTIYKTLMFLATLIATIVTGIGSGILIRMFQKLFQ